MGRQGWWSRWGWWRDNTSLEWTRLSAGLVRVAVGEVGRVSGGGRPARRAPQLEAVSAPPCQRGNLSGIM
jgi:hypothetical protein